MNRLHPNRPGLWLLVFIVNPLFLLAQYSDTTANFIFNYPGQSNIAVDGDCHGKLRQMGVPVVSSNDGGTILFSYLDTVTISAVYGSTVGIDSIFQPTDMVFAFWRVTDNHGHTHNFQFPIQFNDLSGPTLFPTNLPASLTFNSIDDVPPPPMVTAIDNCSGQRPVNYVEFPRPPRCAKGTFQRLWFSTDAAGKTTSFYQTIKINADTTKPVITTFPQNGSGDCANAAALYQAWLNAQRAAMSATDLHGIDTIYYTSQPLVNPACGTTLPTLFSAADSCGNVATATATFFILDGTPPVFSQNPLSEIQNCGPSEADSLGIWIFQKANSAATDNCKPAQNLSFSMKIDGLAVDSAGVQVAFIDSKAQLCGSKTIDGNPVSQVNGFVEVEFVVSDGCNSTGRKAAFATRDLTPPNWILPVQDSTFSCEDLTHSLVNYQNNHGGATASDVCSPVFWTNTTVFQPGCGLQNAWEVTFSAADACGNSITDQGVFSYVDTVPPVLSVVPTEVLENCGNADDQQKLTDFIENRAGILISDNCSTPDWISSFRWTTSTGAVGIGHYGIGPYPQIVANSCDWWVDVKFKAADECGTSSERFIRFKIADLMPPVFTSTFLPVTISCGDPLPAAVAPTVSDNCDATVSVSFASLKSDSICAGRYKFTRRWTAEDDCGNTAFIDELINVVDNEGPVFTTFPADTVVDCGAVPAAVTAGNGIAANDVCSGPVAQISSTETNNRHADPTNCGHYSYSILRLFTASDDCGNTRSAIQILTVQDTTRPVFTQNQSITVACQAVAGAASPVAEDACGSPVSLVADGPDVILAGSCADNYTLQKSWKATDACGNESFLIQNVLVSDTTKPTLAGVPTGLLTVFCGQVPLPPVVGQDIFGMDDCDPSVSIFLTETTTQAASQMDCDHYNFFLTREWTVVDNCLNSQVYTQNIQVSDNEPPVLELAGPNLVPTGLNLCGADYWFHPPVLVNDDCTASTLAASPTASANLENTSGQPDFYARVDSLVLNFSLPNVLPEQPASGPATISLQFVGLDGEQPTEFFRIFGEDGSLLGQSPQTVLQCSDTSMSLIISELQLNSWGQDGQLTLVFAPNSDTTAAINKICINSYVAGTAAYNFRNPDVPVDLYYRLDGGAWQPFPQAATEFVSVGNHAVDFQAVDCSGNASTASQTIEVVDIFSPVFVAPNDTVIIASDTCLTRFTLPFPQNLSDNCGFAGNFDQTTPSQPLHFYSDPNAGNVPSPLVLNFTGLVANAISGASLRLNLLADNGDFGEFFQVFDENNNLLGNSNPAGAAQCLTATTTVFNFSANQINVWAADGATYFTLKANIDANIWIDFVNPCGPLNANGFDPATAASGRLNFDFVDIDFTVKTPLGVTVKSGQLVGNQSFTTLPAGQYDVFYKVEDRNGLTAENSYKLTVRDTTRPTAICQPSQFFVNPGGVLKKEITAQELDGGSYDNCPAALTFSFFPDSLDCSFVGANVPILMTVADEWGNSKTCETFVSVQTVSPAPAFLAGSCENDTLQLFANPPASPGNVVYTYAWSGPNNFLSNAENPIIPQANLGYEGSFQLVVTGLTGCTAAGFTTVDIVNLPAQPNLFANAANFCDGDNFILKTQTVNGSNASYFWYAGQFPGGILLGTTILPEFLVPGPAVGNHEFYVMTEANGCRSLPSENFALTVFAIPAAALVTPGITVCEGDPIILSTTTAGPTVEYLWTGPNGFHSTEQSPAAILSAIPVVHEGNYHLVIKENGCPAAAASTNVLVTPRPATPEIGTDLPKCTGQTLQLVSNITNAQTWIWLPPSYPNDPADTTTVNALTIPNANSSQSGDWRVLIFKQGCPSDTSAAGLVIVKDFPSVAATSNGPICEGDPLVLTTTTDQISGSIFHWNGPAGFNSFGQNPTLTQPVSGIYSVTVTNDIGCSTFDTTTVSIAPRPIVATIITDAPVCENSSQDIHLQALVSPADLTYNYLWTGPGGWSSSDKSPILSGATVAWNGSYTLSVIKNLGQNICISNPKSVAIAIQPTPLTPQISSVAPLCAGAGFSILVMNPGDYPSNAKFIWHTPLGVNPPSMVPGLTVAASNIAYSGNYWLEVDVNGCKSGSSAITNVLVHPIPNPPLVTTNSPVCEGDAIEMSAPLWGGVSYQWFGPGGWTASVFNPTRPAASLNFGGQYFLKISQNGCESTFSEPITIVVKPRPAVPSLSGVPQICLDSPGASLILAVNPQTQTGGADYSWFQQINPATQQLLTNTGLSAGLNYGSLNGFSMGTAAFTAVANLNGCASANSLPFLVDFFEIPTNQADAGIDRMGCFGQKLMLLAQNPSVGSGKWTQFSGQPVLISNPNLALTTVSGNPPTGNYQFIWTLSNGACLNYSSDTFGISISEFEQANSGPAIDTCYATSLKLNAQPSLNGNGFWTQPLVQSLLNVVISDPSNPATTITGLTPGSIYTFTWNLPDQGCGPTTSDLLVWIVNSVSYAGQDRVECPANGCVVLQAGLVGQFETGEWTSLNPAVTIANPELSITDACGLTAGENRFVWTLNDGMCGQKGRDTLVLTYEPAPVLLPDTVSLVFGTTQRMDVLLNDGLPANWDFAIETGVSQGILTEINAGLLDYQPKIGFTGSDHFTYKVCNLACVNSCSIAEVILQIAAAGECEPPTIITPNGDGTNDAFVISCLNSDGNDGSEVSIFNEWGDEVFHAAPYRNDWNGTYNGQDLPAGTYFWVIKMSETGGTTKGFLVIQR